jgi:hypothetical protein
MALQPAGVGKRNAGSGSFGVASASPRSAIVVADAETREKRNECPVQADVTRTWRRRIAARTRWAQRREEDQHLWLASASASATTRFI